MIPNRYLVQVKDIPYDNQLRIGACSIIQRIGSGLGIVLKPEGSSLPFGSSSAKDVTEVTRMIIRMKENCLLLMNLEV